MVQPSLGRLTAVLGAIPLCCAALAAVADEAVNTTADNVAILGYDPVAYFTEARAVKGDPEIAYDWQGARWQFATPEHRARFAENPEKYAPRYGGFCSSAMAVGRKAPIDPEAWVIIEDKLYLAFSSDAIDRFAVNAETTIPAADGHWQELGRIE
jgi:YHS domain-containing protein